MSPCVVVFLSFLLLRPYSVSMARRNIKEQIKTNFLLMFASALVREVGKTYAVLMLGECSDDTRTEHLVLTRIVLTLMP